MASPASRGQWNGGGFRSREVAVNQSLVGLDDLRHAPRDSIKVALAVLERRVKVTQSRVEIFGSIVYSLQAGYCFSRRNYDAGIEIFSHACPLYQRIVFLSILSGGIKISPAKLTGDNFFRRTSDCGLQFRSSCCFRLGHKL